MKNKKDLIKFKQNLRCPKIPRNTLYLFDGDTKKFIRIKNCYLVECKPENITQDETYYGPDELFTIPEDIEVTLRFKAPFRDKNGHLNATQIDKKLKRTRSFIIK